jgi:hypothetical protein
MPKAAVTFTPAGYSYHTMHGDGNLLGCVIQPKIRERVHFSQLVATSMSLWECFRPPKRTHLPLLMSIIPVSAMIFQYLESRSRPKLPTPSPCSGHPTMIIKSSCHLLTTQPFHLFETRAECPGKAHVLHHPKPPPPTEACGQGINFPFPAPTSAVPAS